MLFYILYSRKIVKKGILLALMALSLVLGSSVAAQAAELTSSVPSGRNINDHVTSLTIQSAQLQDGQIQSGADLSVQGTFSDEKGPIKNGDVIQVDWPHDQTAYLTGYSGQKPLYLAGVNVADYVVSAERARLVFNANVEQLKQVQGELFLCGQGVQPIRAGASRRRGGWRPANRSHGCGAADRQRGA